ncbi:DUF397 domain-containing protein [Streptomyces sp. NPDC046909]|uniref:DUF397 domain-containing protein n=1 Tax=Streptomyces sp. NPDC046909 TaxID=3155617 RepID=UPI0033D75F23
MQTVDPNWRTSSYTGTENCIEVADNEPTMVMVRDTKARSRGINRPDGRLGGIRGARQGGIAMGCRQPIRGTGGSYAS